MWMEGWGVSFGAYYDWKDLSTCNGAANVSAFLPEDSNAPLLGREGEVMPDDGKTYPDVLEGEKDSYRYFGADIDGDGDTTERNILYAQTAYRDDVALAAQNSLEKKVRADADRFGVYQEEAAVALGEGYTYEFTVTSISDTSRDLVVFDRLENAPKYQSQQEEMEFEENYWYGTFDGVVTTGLEEKGIAPVIYYNSSRDALLPTGDQSPGEVLTPENGWYTRQAWEEAGKALGEVKALAVDLSRRADGEAFTLAPLESVTFQVHMRSPEEEEALEEADHSNTYLGDAPARYAYNNGAFYSVAEETKTAQTVTGNSTRVSQGREQTLEVVKEIQGEVPESMEGWEFLFTATLKGEALGSREYELYRKEGEAWVREGEDRVYATDTEGNFSLKGDEKAVFRLESLEGVSVEEEENPFWEVTRQEEQEGDRTTWRYQNAYRPVLYAQKKVTAYPDGWTQGTLQRYSFTYQLEVNGEVGANVDYWIVDQARTDGGIPKKLGEGTTDGEGKFQISVGEVVALFPGIVGDAYEVREVEGAGEGTDWMVQEPASEGTLKVNGSLASITNIYRWKDLYLTKEITHQEAGECTQAFTFQVTSDGKPLAHAKWVLMEEGEDTPVQGTTDEEGKFRVACAGKTVRIEGFEGGKAYAIQEVESGQYYRPVSDRGEGFMPVYGRSQEAEITNDYLLRPIRVTKTVSYDPESITEEELEELGNKEFTMAIQVGGEAYAYRPYLTTKGGVQTGTGTTDGEGKFPIRDGETVTFPEAGIEGTAYRITESQEEDYPQLYPADGAPIEGTIGAEGSSASFLNGMDPVLIIGKEYVAAEGDNGEGAAYVERMKTDPDIREYEAVELTLEIQEEDGSWEKWPQTYGTIRIQILDTLDGSVSYQYLYNQGEAIKLEPWERVILNNLELDTRYRVSEREEDQYKIYSQEEFPYVFLEITQKEPEGNQPQEGTIQDKPLALITNQVKGLDETSAIYKKMRPGSTDVPSGARLTFQVQRYDGNVWLPAEGVPYVLGDDSGWLSDRIDHSDEEGKIQVEKTDTGYPVLTFTEQEITVHPLEEKEGTYRIVELLGESDPQWGKLSGYMDSPEDEVGDLLHQDACGFINNNRITQIEIAKEMEGEREKVFTFVVNQVTEYTSPIEDAQDILETTLGTNLDYGVYDRETDAYLSTGNTGNTGEVRLQPGQYAKVQVPDGTLWTVTEKQENGYTLTDLQGTEGETTKLSENLILLGADAPVIPGKLTAVRAFF